MLRRLLYNWSTNSMWEVYSNGVLISSISCPIGIDMSKMTIKAVYNPEFHEIVICAENPAQKKMVVTDIEDAAPQRPNSAGRQKSNGSRDEYSEPDRRQKQD